MALRQTDIKARKLKLDRWQKQIADLDRPWDGDGVGWLERFCTKPTQYDNALGTVGGGNHFAELQIVEHVADAETFNALGLDTDRLLVLVHSGSRRVGEEVHRAYRERHGHEGLIEHSEGGMSYLGAHRSALAWAVASSTLLCHRFMESLRMGGRPVLDVPHNLYQEAPEAYKRIEQVIDALMGAGLVRVIATFRPLITFKTRRRSK